MGEDVKKSATVMGLTTIGFLVAQIGFYTPASFNDIAVAGACVCIVMLVGYCAIQALEPQYVKSRIRKAKVFAAERQLMESALRMLTHENMQGPVIGADLDRVSLKEGLRKVFKHFDKDNTGHLSPQEVLALLNGIAFVESGDVLAENDEHTKWIMEKFDKDKSDSIDEEEFLEGTYAWFETFANDYEKRKGGLFNNVFLPSAAVTPSQSVLMSESYFNRSLSLRRLNDIHDYV